MARISIQGFIQETESRFGENVDTVLRKALDLILPLDDMILLVCLFIKHTSDALLDEKAFIADGHALGLLTITTKLREIVAEIEKDRMSDYIRK